MKAIDNLAFGYRLSFSYKFGLYLELSFCYYMFVFGTNVPFNFKH